MASKSGLGDMKWAVEGGGGSGNLMGATEIIILIIIIIIMKNFVNSRFTPSLPVGRQVTSVAMVCPRAYMTSSDVSGLPTCL